MIFCMAFYFFDIKRDNVTFLNMFDFLDKRKVNTLISYNVNNPHCVMHRIQNSNVYVSETIVQTDIQSKY